MWGGSWGFKSILGQIQMMDNLVSMVLCGAQAFKAVLLPPVCCDLSAGWVFIWILWCDSKTSLGELTESPLAASPHSHFANAGGFQSISAAETNPG